MNRLIIAALVLLAGTVGAATVTGTGAGYGFDTVLTVSGWEAGIWAGTADPSAGAGFNGSAGQRPQPGSLYLRYDSATPANASLWIRTDTGATDWAQMAASASVVTDHGGLTGLTDDDHTQYGALAQNETIGGDWVNTAYPWADNEVADTLTVGNAGSVDPDALSTDTTDNDGIDNTPIGAGVASTGAFTTLGASGNVTFAGSYTGSGSPSVTGTGTRLMWFPARAAFRAGYVSGTPWNTMGNFSVAMGLSGTATGQASTVGGGSGNSATADIATVAGGQLNAASASLAFVGGGSGNAASGGSSVICGGNSNVASGDDGLLAQGSVIVGGYSNTSSARGTFVGAGSYNTAAGQFSSVLGGHTNTTNGSAQYSAALGGLSCAVGADGDYGTSIGGQNADVNGDYSVAQGQNVNVTGDRSWLIGHDTSSATMSQDDSWVLYNDDNGGYSVGVNVLDPLSGRPGAEVSGEIEVVGLDETVSTSAAGSVLSVTGGGGGDGVVGSQTGGVGETISLVGGEGGAFYSENENADGGNGGSVTIQGGEGGECGDAGSAGDWGTVILQALGGSVGIGTTSPLSPLHVIGAAGPGSVPTADDLLTIEDSGSNYLNIISGAALSGGVLFSDGVRAVGWVLYNHSTNAMSLQTNGSVRMTIDSSGQVGINDTTPSYRLDVNGAVRGIDYYSGDGTQGITDSIYIEYNSGGSMYGLTITVKDGLVTGWSNTEI